MNGKEITYVKMYLYIKDVHQGLFPDAGLMLLWFCTYMCHVPLVLGGFHRPWVWASNGVISAVALEISFLDSEATYKFTAPYIRKETRQCCGDQVACQLCQSHCGAEWNNTVMMRAGCGFLDS